MNRKTMIIVIVVEVVLLIGLSAAYFIKSSHKSKQQTRTESQEQIDQKDKEQNGQTSQEQENGEVTDSQPVTKKMKIGELFVSNESQKCTYTLTVDGETTTGTVYTSNQMIRADQTMTFNGEAQKLSVIATQSEIYFWAPGDKEGSKQKYDQATKDEMIQDTTLADTTCQKWQVDENMFKPPTDVTFTDWSTYTENEGMLN